MITGWRPGGKVGKPGKDTIDQPAAPPKGRASGSNTRAELVLVSGPSTQAVALARGLGLAVNTASPMSRGMRVWGAGTGVGVNRFGGLRPAPHGGPVQGAVAPVAAPVSPLVGNPMAFPSAGRDGGFGGLASVAALDMGRLHSLGWGS